MDYAVWELNPFGYNLTNLVLHILNALLVLALGRRLGLRRWSATVAALVFALHPVMASAVPAVARRQDALAGLFLFSALLTAPRPSSPGSLGFGLRLCIAGTLFLIAVLAKEVALAALPVAVIFCCPDLMSTQTSINRAYIRRVVVPVLIAFGVPSVLALAMRFVVLRGLGGYLESAGALGDVSLEAYGQVFASFVGFLLWTIPGLESFTFPLGIVVGVGLALSIPGWRQEIVPLVVGAVWLSSFCFFYMVLKLLGASAWYMYLPLAGWGLALGAVLQACLPRFGTVARTRAARLAARRELGTPILFLCAAMLVGTTVWWSPLIAPYPSWADGSQIVRVYVEDAQNCFEQVPIGTQLRLDNVPSGMAYHDRKSRIAGVTLLDDYSVQALTDLLAADKRLRVHMNSGALVRQPSPAAHVECASASDGWHLRMVGLR